MRGFLLGRPSVFVIHPTAGAERSLNAVSTEDGENDLEENREPEGHLVVLADQVETGQQERGDERQWRYSSWRLRVGHGRDGSLLGTWTFLLFMRRRPRERTAAMANRPAGRCAAGQQLDDRLALPRGNEQLRRRVRDRGDKESRTCHFEVAQRCSAHSRLELCVTGRERRGHWSNLGSYRAKASCFTFNAVCEQEYDGCGDPVRRRR